MQTSLDLESDSVRVLPEEEVPETAQVIPMNPERTIPKPPLPLPQSPPKPRPPSPLLVYSVLTAILSARLLSLLLVLLDMAIACATVYSPTQERLIAMADIFAFSLASFWMLGRLEPSKSVANKD